MFSRLIGNTRIKEILSRFLEKGRVPNALLFAGEEGVGKKQFALELAKAFICQNTKDHQACDECNACRRAGVFSFPKPDDKDEHKKVICSEHADVGMVIPYNRNILIDAIRELEKEANFRPYEAAARFFIIDDADKMNDAASNALLKTLEEPPPTSHIFLISSRADSLLPTIRSRCQVLRFAQVEPREIQQFLINTKKFSPVDAGLTARLSAGSVGIALSTDMEKFRVRREAMTEVLQSVLVKNNRAALLRTAEEISDAKNKEHYEDYLKILQTLIHDVWILRLADDEERIVNVDLIPQLSQFAEKTDAQILSGWLNEIELLRESLAVNVNKRIATDALFMEMASRNADGSSAKPLAA